MKSTVFKLEKSDLVLLRQLEGFAPKEVYDIHAHSLDPLHYETDWTQLTHGKRVGCKEHRKSIQTQTFAETIHGLYFGMPHKTANRAKINDWIADDVRSHGTDLSRALLLVSPQDDREQVAGELRSGKFCGIKVYHVYASRPDTMHAELEEYAPEWMWELLHEIKGILMLHIVRTDAIEDEKNQKSLKRLCRAHPNCQVILAHVARSFNYRNARKGLHILGDLDNVSIDTSAVTETESFRKAIEVLGPARILYGSDFPVNDRRGRCVTTGEYFFWLLPEVIDASYSAPTESQMTLIGIESLLCLQEASEDSGLDRKDIDAIFLNNALRLLSSRLPSAKVPSAITGPQLWQKAREVISCGTGLLSKRAEMYDAEKWPAYFSKCSGCEVWDLEGRRYVDFAGGVGAILLGYADPDVTAAVRRRLNQGTYCTLVNPQEVELAERLLALHPWAGQVRYARGGGDAMTMAVRIARAGTGKSGVAFCGYHGWHDWYLAANLAESKMLDGHLLPGLEPKGVPRELVGTSVAFKYNDFDSYMEALRKIEGNFAAVVMEPMRSQFPKDNFVQKVADACREKGGVFIVDEITSGLRFGYPGALSRIGVDPDMVVYAKAMSNGFPFGVVIGNREIMTKADSSFISSSYWTDGVGPAVALAVLEKIEKEKVYEAVWKMGEVLQKGLNQLATQYPACKLVVGGMPAAPNMSFGLGSESPKAQALLVRKMQEKGFLVSTVYYVMFTHDTEKIAAFLDALSASLAEIERIIQENRLAEEISGHVERQGFSRLA